MNMLEMRRWVSDQYPSMKWKGRVSKMPDRQVIAIYKSMQMRETKSEPKKQEEFHQMDIWEWAYSKALADGAKGSHTDIPGT